MRQEVVVTRCADRHAVAHEREFAESHAVVVQAGGLGDVVAAALADARLTGAEGRWVLVVGEPFA